MSHLGNTGRSLGRLSSRGPSRYFPSERGHGDPPRIITHRHRHPIVDRTTHLSHFHLILGGGDTRVCDGQEKSGYPQDAGVSPAQGGVRTHIHTHTQLHHGKGWDGTGVSWSLGAYVEGGGEGVHGWRPSARRGTKPWAGVATGPQDNSLHTLKRNGVAARSGNTLPLEKAGPVRRTGPYQVLGTCRPWHDLTMGPSSHNPQPQFSRLASPAWITEKGHVRDVHLRRHDKWPIMDNMKKCFELDSSCQM